MDDMLQYVYSSNKSMPDQAVDVLRSGLSSNADPSEGVKRGRSAFIRLFSCTLRDRTMLYMRSKCFHVDNDCLYVAGCT